VKKRKLIIISDLHIGGDNIIEDFECETELIDFLQKKKDPSYDLELLILGDFLDLWKVEKDAHEQVRFVINKHKKLFKTFKRFGEHHKITVVPGNHDHALAYNVKYQQDLAEYNMTVEPHQYIKRTFEHKKNSFTLIGEHGNQVEPSTTFPQFDLPTDSSLAYHINKILVYKLMRMGNEKKSPYWLRDLDSIDTELIPYWALSKYFYYELGPILKAILIPMLVLFGFAVPYFIFDVITEFYQPNFIKPLLLLLDTNTFFKVLIFLLYFDMVVVILVIFIWFIKKEFRKRLREYGIHSFSEILVSRYHSYKKRAKEILIGNNPFNEPADLYVTGHTHVAGFHKFKESGKLFVDSGSWKQLMKRINARFRFPSVYSPYFSLSYVTIEQDADRINICLNVWPKTFKAKLTVLERFAIKWKKVPRSVEKDTVVEEHTIWLSEASKESKGD
jgi:UDP-2,3-diacylglucosamine pyrophosphatase LpxH